MDNAFNKEVLFNISVKYERNGVIKGGKPAAGAAQGKGGDKKGPQAAASAKGLGAQKGQQTASAGGGAPG